MGTHTLTHTVAHDFFSGLGEVRLDDDMIAVEHASGFVSTDLHGDLLRHSSLYEVAHAAPSQVVEERAGVLSHGGWAACKSNFYAGGFPDAVDGLDPLPVPVAEPWAGVAMGEPVAQQYVEVAWHDDGARGIGFGVEGGEGELDALAAMVERDLLGSKAQDFADAHAGPESNGHRNTGILRQDGAEALEGGPIQKA